MTATLALWGCVAVDSADEETPLPAGTTPAPATETAAGETPSGQPSATAEPTPGETRGAPIDALAAALSAAGEAFAVPTAATCSGDEDCIQPLPGAGASAGYGLVRFAYVAAGGGGAEVVMGRTPTGEWDLWLLTQGDDRQVVPLPGRLLACPDAETVALRSEPSPGAVESGQVARSQILDADRFVLTAPGTQDAPGSGWYHLTGEAEGWLASSDAVDAAAGTCSQGGGGTVG